MARPIAARWGGTYERYERLGYTRFALVDAKLERPGFLFTARRAEAPSALAYAWGLARRKVGPARIESWRFTTRTGESVPAPTSGPRTVTGFPSLHAQLQKVSQKLSRWLPELEASDGAVDIRGRVLTFPELHWRDQRLALSNAAFLGHSANLELRQDAARDFLITGQSESLAAGLNLTWKPTTAEATLHWADQPAALRAEFIADGWLPGVAQAHARDWRVPARHLRLERFYTEILGSAEIDWRGREFVARATASSAASPANGAPPLEVALDAKGSPESIELGVLKITAPFGKATLSDPIRIGWNGELQSGPAELRAEADLAAVPEWSARGKLQARASIAGRGRDTHGNFDCSAQDLEWRDWRARAFAASGKWRWPRIEVASAQLQLDDQSQLQAQGSYDWSARTISSAKLEGSVSRASLGARLAALNWTKLQGRLSLAGPIAALQHQGEITADALTLAPLRPIDAKLAWRGEKLEATFAQLTAQREAGILETTGTIGRGGLQLKEGRITRDGTEQARLQAPASLSWSPVWRIDNLHVRGAAGASLELSGELGAQLRANVRAVAVGSEALSRWLELPDQNWRVDSLRAEGATQNGALAFQGEAEVSAVYREEALSGKVTFQGDAEGIRVPDLQLRGGDAVLTRLKGRIPARFIPAATGMPALKLEERASLSLEGNVDPNSALWTALAALTGVEVASGRLQASLRGSLLEPEGEVSVQAGEISARRGTLAGKLPKLTDITARATASADVLTLAQLELKVADQPVTARGKIPLPADSWRRPAQLRLADFNWSRGEATVDVPDFDVANLAPLFPALPLTQGRLQASIGYRAEKLHGQLSLRDARARPFPGFGVVQNIATELKLENRTVQITSAAADIGGEPVHISGSVAVEGPRDFRLSLGLRAENLPLVRRPGLLVRTDLNLRADTDNKGVTRLRGLVGVRDTLVLADLAAILPGGPRGAARQPPYFAIETAPFSSWPIDVQVQGTSSVRVRTAVFNGVASPNFHLTGTLGEPRATGQLSVDEGRVLFPFASFDVQSGAVRLRESDPHALSLSVNAVARRHGYELRLDARGTVDNPIVTLSSNPPLEAAEVLLMVTTGQPPPDDNAPLTGQRRLTQLGTFLGRGLFQNLGVGGEDRLEITAGEEVSEQGRETYQIEYRLNDRLSLTGEYDEYDHYNAGIKWRLFMQGDRPSDHEKK